MLARVDTNARPLATHVCGAAACRCLVLYEPEGGPRHKWLGAAGVLGAVRGHQQLAAAAGEGGDRRNIHALASAARCSCRPSGHPHVMHA